MKANGVEIIEEVENVFDSKGMPKKILNMDKLENKKYDWRFDFLNDSLLIKRGYFPSMKLEEFKDVYEIFKKKGNFFLYFSKIKEDEEYNFNKFKKAGEL